MVQILYYNYNLPNFDTNPLYISAFTKIRKFFLFFFIIFSFKKETQSEKPHVFILFLFEFYVVVLCCFFSLFKSSFDVFWSFVVFIPRWYFQIEENIKHFIWKYILERGNVLLVSWLTIFLWIASFLVLINQEWGEKVQANS